ncbi:MAG: response regulator transcription factor [Romboutsia sp.]
MEVLVVSKSFIVREALESFFKGEFEEYGFRGVRNLIDIKNIDLTKVKFIFLDVESTILENINIIKEHIQNAIIMIFDKNSSRKNFLKSIKCGVNGYIVEIPDKEDFIYIIKKMLTGKTYYDTELLQNIIQDEQDESSNLTYRENEVLNEIRKGITNREIAQNLYVTEHTIKKHITNILLKMKMKNRKELIINCK